MLEQIAEVAQELVKDLNTQANTSAEQTIRIRGAVEGIQLLYSKLEEQDKNGQKATKDSKIVDVKGTKKSK